MCSGVQGDEKSFVQLKQLLLGWGRGQNRHNGQAIPMKGTAGSNTWAAYATWAYEQCARVLYSATAILPLSVYIVGAAIVFLVPSKSTPEDMDSAHAHGLPT